MSSCSFRFFSFLIIRVSVRDSPPVKKYKCCEEDIAQLALSRQSLYTTKTQNATYDSPGKLLLDGQGDWGISWGR